MVLIRILGASSAALINSPAVYRLPIWQPMKPTMPPRPIQFALVGGRIRARDHGPNMLRLRHFRPRSANRWNGEMATWPVAHPGLQWPGTQQ